MEIFDQRSFERRKEPRQSSSESIFFARMDRLYEAELKDFNQHGLFIRTDQPLSLGEIVTVALPCSSKKNDKRQGRIIRSTPEGFGIKLLTKLNGKDAKFMDGS